MAIRPLSTEPTNKEMIVSISGLIKKVGNNYLVVTVGGVGVRVFVPRTVLENNLGVGRSISLHTHFLLRENEMALYGFESEEDLSIFELLLEVNGVGPKAAIAILSTLSPELLKNAIIREEPAILQRVPGVGKKTAERILFQLKDKVAVPAGATAIPFVADVDSDVIEFLTGLGFSIVEAQTALQHIPRDIKEINDRLQHALRYLDK